MKFLALLSLALLSTSSISANVQSPKARGNLKRAEAIKKSYLESYSEYLKYACKDGKCDDQLNPLSKSSSSPFGVSSLTCVGVIQFTFGRSVTHPSHSFVSHFFRIGELLW